jgi:hypothetical protein
MSKKRIIKIVIVAVIVVGLSFYSGMKFGGRKSSPGSMGQFGQRNTSGTSKGMRSGTGVTSGEVIAKDNETLTIKMIDGSTKIVFYSPSTDLQKTVAGNIADLVVGKEITVIGPANADGSLTAKSIQLRTAPATPPQN